MPQRGLAKRMAPSLLFDLSKYDLNTVKFGVDVIESINPHRGAMRLLDGVYDCNLQAPAEVLAYKDIRDDEFWVPGHVPGRPLFPGVLMLEAAAQLARRVGVGGPRAAGYTTLAIGVFLGGAAGPPPAFVHGGAIATMLDSQLGQTCMLNGTPGFTAYLSIKYKAPIPLSAQGTAVSHPRAGKLLREFDRGDTACRCRSRFASPADRPS